MTHRIFYLLPILMRISENGATHLYRRGGGSAIAWADLRIMLRKVSKKIGGTPK